VHRSGSASTRLDELTLVADVGEDP